MEGINMTENDKDEEFEEEEELETSAINDAIAEMREMQDRAVEDIWGADE